MDGCALVVGGDVPSGLFRASLQSSFLPSELVERRPHQEWALAELPWIFLPNQLEMAHFLEIRFWFRELGIPVPFFLLPVFGQLLR